MSARHRGHLKLSLFVVLATAVAAVAQREPFSIEQVMSAPFSSGLVSAPVGNKIAWVFDASGVRNIWFAEAPDFRARALTSYTSDDGQEIAELAWTPDARAVVYVRGGDFETSREVPNPLGSPQGVEQALWIIDVTGTAPRKLGEGHSPSVSPKGDAVAYLYKDEVWLARLSGDAKPVQLVHARGKAGQLCWSPDGSKLALSSGRDDHSFIGIYDFSRQTLRYLDPSVDRDQDPVWSPDAREIAYLRLPTVAEPQLIGPKRAGSPWSIRLADASTGKGHEVWRARVGQGSVFHPLATDQQLFWAARDRLIFPWEGDGWLHLYSVRIGGGPATLMTPGQFEVENVALSPSRREIAFNSNQNDSERRHLWIQSVEVDQPSPLTSGRGIEWTPAFMSDGRHIALLRSDAQQPGRPAVVDLHGTLRELAPAAMPTDFPASELVDPEPVTFPSADGIKIHGQLFISRGSAGAETRRPAVVFFHGGPHRQMLLGWHYMRYYHNAYALNQYLASRGYVVLSVNYRGGLGEGMESREALQAGPGGASEYNDVKGAALYLRSRPDVDPARIGLWGGSYGGYLTALGLARASDVFACGVDFHGVHDWNFEAPHILHAEDPKKLEDWARLAYQSSPLADVKTWRSPVLLIQGDDDRNVAFANMVQLVVRLREQGVEFRQMVFPDEVHDFLTHEHWLTAYHAAADFLDEHLKADPGRR